MFPWNYGFAWDAGHIIFLGVFYTVIAVVVTTLAYAAWRARRDVRTGRAARVMWHENFEDLPRAERGCRHAFTGEMKGRVCQRGFACGECQTHARIVGEHLGTVLPGVVDDSLGIDVPLDRYYHRGHVWAKPESDGTYTLGLDEIAKRVAARPESIELPAPGTQLAELDTAWTMRVNGNAVRVKAPFAAEVVERGTGDWMLRVKPAPEAKFDHLLRGREVACWLGHEMERVQLAVSETAAVPALADGGVPVDNFPAACPQADWDSITGALFLEN
jgi:hypothetical protein